MAAAAWQGSYDEHDTTDMQKIALKLAYDGTDYCGWQVQGNGISVQQKVDEALTRICKEPVHCLGASRTDAGVHARGNVAAFETAIAIDPERMAYAMNALLPADVACLASWGVPAAFNPRFDAERKTYEYRIRDARFPDPLRARFSLHSPLRLDETAMDQAAKAILGEHDFTSFSNVHAQSKTRVRTIYGASVRREGDEVVFSVTGNGFLYNMVRILTGTLLQIGTGKRRAGEMAEILRERNRSAAGPTAPPQGLVLAEILYPQFLMSDKSAVGQ